MTGRNQHLGKAGEEAAARFLNQKGYTLLARNFRSRTFEIDLVAEKNGAICFIEVKTRKSLLKGSPREAVGPAKQQKLVLGAAVYLKQQKLSDRPVRFEVVEVLARETGFEITHIENAFEGGER